jgi:3-oxoacyl-[acyl-carrier-protein] synthase III
MFTTFLRRDTIRPELPAAAQPAPVVDRDCRRTVIESLGVYLPPKAVSSAEVLQGCRKRVLFPLEKMTGIHSRRMAGDGEYAIDLARKVMAECLATSRHTPAEIELLICCNISHCDLPGSQFILEPSTAARLRHEFGLGRAQAFDISNACAGFFTAIYLIDAMLQAGVIRCGMAVSGEYISHLTRTAQKEIEGLADPRLACLTVGDAGAAVILERAEGPGPGFEEISVQTLGKHSRHCIAKATDRPHGGAVMFTDPMSITSVAVRQGAAHARHTLRARGWDQLPIDHIIMHQTSETAMRGAVRELNATIHRDFCRPDNVVINVGERGNTATTTHMVALADQMNNGRIKTGDRVLFGIAGSGQTVGTALYTLDDLPDRHRCAQPDRSGDTAPAVLSPPTTPRWSGVRIESLGTAPGAGGLGQDTLGLARVAAEDCLGQSAHPRGEVDLLLFAGVYRSEFLCEPAVAAMLAGDLGINGEAVSPGGPATFAFDVLNGGVGFLNACHIASELIRTGKHRVALVTASEVDNNRGTAAPPLGVVETGSAVVLDDAPGGDGGFGRFLFRAYPEHLGRFTSHTALEEGRTVLRAEQHSDYEEALLHCAADAARALLEREGVFPSDLKVILPSQISPWFSSGLAGALSVDPDKCVTLDGSDGDYFTSSLVFALRQVIDRGMTRPGDVGLIIAAGAGAQVGCVLYQF